MYQKHNKSIGIVQWRMDDEELEDIYYMSIRLGVEKRAAELGCDLLKISNLDESVIQSVDGLLAIGKFTEERVKKLHELHPNLCVIGSNFPLDDYDSVNTDFTQATELALSHLMGLGHQKSPLSAPRKVKICMGIGGTKRQRSTPMSI